MIRSLPPGAALTRSSGTRSRRSPFVSRRMGSISRASSRTGSCPISIVPTDWRPPWPTRGRRAELDDVGLMRMLAPEQVERKVAAVFGQPWGKLNDQLAMLYGGIDSKEVTERAADPSGAMGAIQRILANDVACSQTALDFSRPPAERRLFPRIEPDVMPGVSPEADAKIRRAIVYLHERVLGRHDAPDSAEVDRTFQLFAGIVADAAGRKKIDPRGNLHLPPGTAHARSRSKIHGSRLASRPDIPASAAGISLRVTYATRFPETLRPGRSGLRMSRRHGVAAGELRPAKSRHMTGHITSSSTPPAAGTRPT